MRGAAITERMKSNVISFIMQMSGGAVRCVGRYDERKKSENTLFNSHVSVMLGEEFSTLNQSRLRRR
jgi:hypothetical protein